MNFPNEILLRQFPHKSIEFVQQYFHLFFSLDLTTFDLQQNMVVITINNKKSIPAIIIKK